MKGGHEQLELQVDLVDEVDFGAWVRALPRRPFGEDGSFGTPAQRARRSRRRDAVRAWPDQRGDERERAR